MFWHWLVSSHVQSNVLTNFIVCNKNTRNTTPILCKTNLSKSIWDSGPCSLYSSSHVLLLAILLHPKGAPLAFTDDWEGHWVYQSSSMSFLWNHFELTCSLFVILKVTYEMVECGYRGKHVFCATVIRLCSISIMIISYTVAKYHQSELLTQGRLS